MPLFNELPILTPRLVLRPLEEADAEDLYVVFADPEVMRYWATVPWTSIDQAHDRIKKDQELLAQGSALRLALQPVGTTTVVGAVSVFAFEAQSQRAELGYILARKAWGTGLMHEALTALVNYAVEKLNVRRLEADIDPRNERSARSLERLGFSREGLLRERWVVGTEISDTALYGLLAREWLQQQGRKRSET